MSPTRGKKSKCDLNDLCDVLVVEKDTNIVVKYQDLCIYVLLFIGLLIAMQC